jgi:hypothetical protein
MGGIRRYTLLGRPTITGIGFSVTKMQLTQNTMTEIIRKFGNQSEFQKSQVC